ncbi:MAG: hypothetical protein HY675_24580 [Chloroflexi bacterium]|nr:hypothetical protein [Chloroflexota bacterium]
MPIYEYECLACGVHFERRQSVKDEPIRSCPECPGQARKVILPVGIIFKGSGFYVTDNRGKNAAATSAQPAAGDNGAKSDTSAKSEKSETKSGAKAGTDAKPAAETGT